MAMVAVGGSIGTGLLLGSAAAIEVAGPAVILTFLFAGLVTLTVTLALSELASLHPAAGSFQLYGELYLNEWAGFLSGAGYWAAIAISIGAEMVASATYMAYWFPSVPAIVWIAIASALLLGVNLLSVGRYGRFEYWFAMIKVVVVFAFILLGTWRRDARCRNTPRTAAGFRTAAWPPCSRCRSRSTRSRVSSLSP
jgi:L-asparagine transporter-like permease